MKTWKTRIMSVLLVIMTLLTLLPTSALAASSTGTGIKPTSNTNYWTTRLLHDGTPYSYKPPMAAGKMLYCLDRGYGYRWGTASFLNSYTYTSAARASAAETAARVGDHCARFGESLKNSEISRLLVDLPAGRSYDQLYEFCNLFAL